MEKTVPETNYMQIKKNDKYDIVVRRFKGTTAMVEFIKNTRLSSMFTHSEHSRTRPESFNGTKSLEEAFNLLLHGWAPMAEKLNNQVKTNINNGYKTKTVYGVQGYQACVPRYLQGMPDSMITTRRIPVKNKVITINKLSCYSGMTSKETIEKESLKVLRLSEMLEKQGYRTNINVVVGFTRNGEAGGTLIVLPVKKSSQRLNVKQMAFPLVHPSFLRRICFAIVERVQECNYRNYVSGYGRVPNNNANMFKEIFKGEIVIPNKVEEEEITDIDKYMM